MQHPFFPLPETRVLNLQGEGRVRVPTTHCEMTAVVQHLESSASAASKKTTTVSEKAVAFLQTKEVKRLQTGVIRVTPVEEYDHERRKQILKGYDATIEVSFRAETEKVAAILDGLMALGISLISSGSFVADAEVMAEAKKESLRKAVEDAKQKAEVVLTGFGLKALEPSEITIVTAGEAAGGGHAGYNRGSPYQVQTVMQSSPAAGVMEAEGGIVGAGLTVKSVVAVKYKY